MKLEALFIEVNELVEEVAALRDDLKSATVISTLSAWLPIDCAPKDGTTIIGYSNGPEWPERFSLIRYDRKRWWECGGNGHVGLKDPVIYWMPIPSPPNEDS